MDSQPISKLEKLTYLFSLLKGKAKKSIQGFAIREQDYDLVIEALDKLFGQNQRLKVSLYRDLQSLPPVGKFRDFCLVIK